MLMYMREKVRKIDNQALYDITALEPSKWPSREAVLKSIKLQMQADEVLGLKPMLVDCETAKEITPEELLDKYWTSGQSFFDGDNNG
jgi:hypothetical protein